MRRTKEFMLLLTFIFLSSFPVSAYAFSINAPNNSVTSICSSGTATTTAYCNDTSTNQNKIYGPTGIITDAIDIISYIGGAAALIVLVIGGFRFVVSGGDSNQVAGARNMIIFAIVGIVIIVAAQTIMRFIIGQL